jgi:hypothetical protein
MLLFILREYHHIFDAFALTDGALLTLKPLIQRILGFDKF